MATLKEALLEKGFRPNNKDEEWEQFENAVLDSVNPKVRTSVEKMSKFLYSADTGIKLDGSKNLATTGAAVYYRGGGWWNVFGYAWDLKDAKDIINALK